MDNGVMPSQGVIPPPQDGSIHQFAAKVLIVNEEDAEKWEEGFLENAGPSSPESVGGYASGTNHVLPTYGYAGMYIMKSYRLLELSDYELQSLKARPRVDVNPIADDVRTRGDAAARQFLDGAVKEALDVAYNNIYAFHAAQ
ncbi:hypothetical protein PIB30_039930 [Stylosanthes scabra]|uniref:Histidinol dehydrogenase n=1 Tax=Stylosanthes scabra TaxID=79078 RepID=A0ABU6REJ0_9FABA|nr:hypothetical protein [Stylosanthes scabra]